MLVVFLPIFEHVVTLLKRDCYKASQNKLHFIKVKNNTAGKVKFYEGTIFVMLKNKGRLLQNQKIKKF